MESAAVSVAIIPGRRKARSPDTSLWMNLFILALPVLMVIALAALGVWLVTIGGRSRT